MVCENCENTHDGTFGSGRFCSLKCSRAFCTKGHRDKINEKIANTIKGKTVKVNKTCKFCLNIFTVFPGGVHQEYCSRTCTMKGNWSNPEYRENLRAKQSVNAKNRHADANTNFGWQTRKNIQPSYPEQIAINVLSSSEIPYERELKVGRYFVDFAISSNKIAIEIDGQQHTKPERQASDKRKDELLAELGWTVYRIKWPTDNIVNKINAILESISST